MAIGKKTGGKPFPKGNNLAKGGKRPGAGRPTREVAEAKKQAGDILRNYLELNLKLLAEAYLKHALEDPATTRHAIDRFLPPAKTEIEAAPRHNVIIETFDPNVERRKVRDRLLQEDEDENT